MSYFRPTQEQVNALLGGLEISTPDKYTIKGRFCKGGYFEFFQAIHKGCKRRYGIVMIKKNRQTGWLGGLTNRCYNEIRSLKLLKHEMNIIRMIDLVQDNSNFAIVLERSVLDLKMILNSAISLAMADKKSILQQILKGLKAIHSYNLMHRDLKPGHILINPNGIVVIADFSWSAEVNHDLYPNINGNVGDVNYRSPEILFGNMDNDCKLDMWAAGCVAVELWSRKRLFAGKDDASQMEKISQRCGFCSDVIWPEAKEFPKYDLYYSAYGGYTENKLNAYLANVTLDEFAAAFLGRLLRLNPAERMSAAEAIIDDFFFKLPMASNDLMPFLTRLRQNAFA